MVVPNDTVKVGAPIARLDDRSLLIRRRASMLRLNSANSDAADDVEIRYAKSALAEAEAELREADLSEIDDQLRNLHAQSPIGGVVLEVNRSVGEWIEKGQPVATIGRIDRLHVHALVDSEQISPAVCRGLPVSVHWTDRSTSHLRSLRGKVLSVDPQMLPGGRFRLHAEIINRAAEDDSSQWLLQPGADVRMKVYSSVATAYDPSRSLQR